MTFNGIGFWNLKEREGGLLARRMRREGQLKRNRVSGLFLKNPMEVEI